MGRELKNKNRRYTDATDTTRNHVRKYYTTVSHDRRLVNSGSFRKVEANLLIPFRS